jgi:hypothetical protein
LNNPARELYPIGVAGHDTYPYVSFYTIKAQDPSKVFSDLFLLLNNISGEFLPTRRIYAYFTIGIHTYILARDHKNIMELVGMDEWFSTLVRGVFEAVPLPSPSQSVDFP